jgi:putative nucleotidyltransferase with HDIG domain
MCNSAYVSPQIEIESIDHAILILGTQVVFQFVLSSVMSNFFESSSRGYSMSKGGLYHHAVSTAIVSEQISKLIGHAAPDTAYTAGLLHDIGKVLLDQFVASARPLFYEKIISEGAHLVDVERSELGITHVEAGMRLAELWEFPSSLQEAIAYHDQPELAQHSKDLAHVVHLADLLMSRFNAGYELEGINTDGLPAHLHYLGLSPSSLPVLLAQIPWKFLGTPGYF